MRTPASDAAATPSGGARATRLASWPQRAAHVLIIAIGWGLYFWFWHLVSGKVTDSRQLMLLLLGATIVVPVMTLSWVLHNVGIHRRRGARRTVPKGDPNYNVDYNGRSILADWPALAREQAIEISVVGRLKCYRALPATDHKLLVKDAADAEIDTEFDTYAL